MTEQNNNLIIARKTIREGIVFWEPEIILIELFDNLRRSYLYTTPPIVRELYELRGYNKCLKDIAKAIMEAK